MSVAAAHMHSGNVFMELTQRIFRAFFWLKLYKNPTLTRKDAVTSKEPTKNSVDVKQAHAVLIVECAFAKLQIKTAPRCLL